MFRPVRAENLHHFCDSFERVKADSTFIDNFFLKFLESSEEIAKLFEGVPIARQKTMLQVSLYWPMLACTGNESCEKRLIELGQFHLRKEVKPHHYICWLNALLSAVEECDQGYDLLVDQSWRAVMSYGAKIMFGESFLNAAASNGNGAEDSGMEAHAEEEDE